MRRWLQLRLRGVSQPRTLASIDAYALWSVSYSPHAHNRLMEVEQQAMARLMPVLADRLVLDLACGSGRYGLLAKSAGARTVVSLDNSLPMLRVGKRSGMQRPAEAGMIALPLKSYSLDVVLCGLALGHLQPNSLGAALQEISRVLRPGGELLLSDFHPFLYLSGGKRTFRAPDGTTYAVEHYPHLAADYISALLAVGMRITALDEPRVELEGRQVPAVLIIRSQRQ